MHKPQVQFNVQVLMFMLIGICTRFYFYMLQRFLCENSFAYSLSIEEGGCEEFLHTFIIKICTHKKNQLEVELLCSCSLTSKVVQNK
jgi:hypothetical protein